MEHTGGGLRNLTKQATRPRLIWLEDTENESGGMQVKGK
jgi:hypothetical protein